MLLHKAPGIAETQGLQLKWWREHMDSYRLSDVTPSVLAEFRDKIAAEPSHHGIAGMGLPEREPRQVRYPQVTIHYP